MTTRSSYHIIDTFNANLPPAVLSTATQIASVSNKKISYEVGQHVNSIRPLTATAVQQLKPISNSVSNSSSTETWKVISCPLPAYFVNSRNPNKTIQIEVVRVFDFTENSDGVEIPATCHSDIALVDASANMYVASTSTLYYTPRSFKIGDNRNTIDMWFYRINGEPVDLHPEKTRVIIELTLVY